MNIRLAIEKDINHIAELYIQNHKSTYKGLLSDEYLDGLTLSYSRIKWEKYINEESNKIWVAYKDSEFLGFIAGMDDIELEHTLYLDSLQITEKARGNGIGTALIKIIGQYALDNHYEKMSVCIVKGNNIAGSLYRKLGAKHYKYFEDYFANTISHSEKLIWNDLGLFK